MRLSEFAQPIRTATSVRETNNQDGSVLLDIKQGICFSMNPVGARIWELLTKECTLDQIATSLETEFSIPRTQIETDICEFIASLATRKLVQCGNQERTTGRWLARIIRSPEAE
jgi:Coenzyme PQQ synthesis protein D (PqqD)